MLGLLLGNACAFSRSWNEFTFILVSLQPSAKEPTLANFFNLFEKLFEMKFSPACGKLMKNKNECEFIPRSRELPSITKQ